MRNTSYIYHAFFVLFLTFSLANCSGNDQETTQTPEFPVMKKPVEETTDIQIPADIKKLLATNTCLGCHKLDKKLIGPSYLDVSERGYTEEELIALIKNPKPENWPDYPPMAPMPWVADEDVKAIASWIASINQAK